MGLNFLVATLVSRFTPAPSERVQRLIEYVRVPSGAPEAHEISG